MSASFADPASVAAITCLIGPPLSRVSEVADGLGRRIDRVDPDARNGSLRFILTRAMRYVPLAGSTSKVGLLSGTPESSTQLLKLNVVARTCGVPLSVIELVAPDVELASRAFRGGLCPNGGLHWVNESDESAGVCVHCGGSVAKLPATEMSAFLDNLHRYRQRAPGLRSTAENLGIVWIIVRSVADLGSCSAAVRDAIERFVADAASCGASTAWPARPVGVSGSAPAGGVLRAGTRGPHQVRPTTGRGRLRPA